MGVVDSRFSSVALGCRAPLGSNTENRMQRGVQHCKEHFKFVHSGPDPTCAMHPDCACLLPPAKRAAFLKRCNKDGFSVIDDILTKGLVGTDTIFNAYTSRQWFAWWMQMSLEGNVMGKMKALTAYYGMMNTREHDFDRARACSKAGNELFVVECERALSKGAGSQVRDQMILAASEMGRRYAIADHDTVGPCNLTKEWNANLEKQIQSMIQSQHSGTDWYIATPFMNKELQSMLEQRLADIPDPDTSSYFRLNEGSGALAMKHPLEEDWVKRAGPSMCRLHVSTDYSAGLAAYVFPVAPVGTAQHAAALAVGQCVETGALNFAVKSGFICGAGFNVESFPVANYATLLLQAGPNFNVFAMQQIVMALMQKIQQGSMLHDAAQSLAAQDYIELQSIDTHQHLNRLMKQHVSSLPYAHVYKLPPKAAFTDMLQLWLSDGAVSVTMPGKPSSFAPLTTGNAALAVPPPPQNINMREPFETPKINNLPFPHAVFEREPRTKLSVAFALPLKPQNTALEQLAYMALNKFVKEKSGMPAKGIMCTWNREPSLVTVEMSADRTNSNSLVDALQQLLQQAPNAANMNFTQLKKQLLGTYAQQSRLSAFVCEQVAASNVWCKSSPLFPPSSSELQNQCQLLSAQDIEHTLTAAFAAPAFVGAVNLPERDIKNLRGCVHLAQGPLQTNSTLHVRPNLSKDMQQHKNLSRDAPMHKFCLVLPFASKTNAADVHCVRACSYVMGNGFFGSLMQKERVSENNCYSIAMAIKGDAALHQHAAVVSTGFTPSKSEFAASETEQLVRDWANGKFTQDQLQAALTGYRGHVSMAHVNLLTSRLRMQHMYNKPVLDSVREQQVASMQTLAEARNVLQRTFADSNFVSCLVR